MQIKLKQLPLLFCFLLSCFYFNVIAQTRPITNYSINDGTVILDKGWVFRDGINNKWLSEDLNIEEWTPIDPTQEYKHLGLNNNPKPITLRLDFIASQIPADTLYLCIDQSVASRIYLNEKLISAYGHFSESTKTTQAYNPQNRPIKINLNKGGINSLVVQVEFEAFNNFFSHPAFRFLLFSATIASETKAFDYYRNSNSRFTTQGLIRLGIFLMLFMGHFISFLFYPTYRLHLWFALTALTWCCQNLLMSQFYLIDDVNTRMWFSGLLYFADTAAVLLQFTCIFIIIKSATKIQVIVLGLLMLAGLFTNQIFDFVGVFGILWLLVLPGFGAWVCYPHISSNTAAKFVFYGAISFGVLFALFVTFAPYSFSAILFNAATLSVPISISMAISQNFRVLNLDLRKQIEDNKLLATEKEALLTNQKVELEHQVKARTTELEASLQNLKATQSQLIQSEKMASLGELTAGIAHEIQNPLNFVNNFSEVNSELVNELENAAASGNLDEIKTLVKDIKENEIKIAHHGKRADGIVKSMLQHSRTSSGQKELTDINALCDEYLRLSYHGYRAKDKSFNAKFETNFDSALPKINVVPQDIGRVILNLINNAFYAVNEKAKQNITGYEPTVSIITKNENDRVLILVKDNGNGIPDSLKEKIFQPFFTTKPTGQGTGLGLSLSYDIIKTHSGEIQVDSSTAGTYFLLKLPIG